MSLNLRNFNRHEIITLIIFSVLKTVRCQVVATGLASLDPCEGEQMTLYCEVATNSDVYWYEPMDYVSAVATGSFLFCDLLKPLRTNLNVTCNMRDPPYSINITVTNTNKTHDNGDWMCTQTNSKYTTVTLDVPGNIAALNNTVTLNNTNIVHNVSCKSSDCVLCDEKKLFTWQNNVSVEVESSLEVLDSMGCEVGYCYRFLYGNFKWVNPEETNGTAKCCLSSCDVQSCDTINFVLIVDETKPESGDDPSSCEAWCIVLIILLAGVGVGGIIGGILWYKKKKSALKRSVSPNGVKAEFPERDSVASKTTAEQS